MIERFRKLVDMSDSVVCAFCKKEIEIGQEIVVDAETGRIYCNDQEISCVIQASFKEGTAIRGISCVMPDIRDLL